MVALMDAWVLIPEAMRDLPLAVWVPIDAAQPDDRAVFLVFGVNPKERDAGPQLYVNFGTEGAAKTVRLSETNVGTRVRAADALHELLIEFRLQNPADGSRFTDAITHADRAIAAIAAIAKERS